VTTVDVPPVVCVRDDTPPEAWEPELWIDEGPVRAAAKKAVARGNEADKRLPRRRLPAEVVDELDTLGGPKHAARLEERLEAARRAFDRDRWPEAARILAKLAREAPGSPSVRELHGLTLYRLERWRAAAGELEAYRTLTGAVDQNRCSPIATARSSDTSRSSRSGRS
jgi:hypothetical protein